MHSFANRVVTIWNDLPEQVVSAKNVQSFEARLDKFWENQEFKYDWTARYKSRNGKKVNLTFGELPE